MAIGLERQRRGNPGNDGIPLVLRMPVLPVVDGSAHGHATIRQRDLARVAICVALRSTGLTDERDVGVLLERVRQHLRGRERGRPDDAEQTVLVVDALGLHERADQRNDEHSVATPIEAQIHGDFLGPGSCDLVVQARGELGQRFLGRVRDGIDLHVEQRAQALEMECLGRAAQPGWIRLARNVARVDPPGAAIECRHLVAAHDLHRVERTQRYHFLAAVRHQRERNLIHLARDT